MSEGFITQDNARRAVLVAAAALEQIGGLSILSKAPQGYFVVVDARNPYHPLERPTAPVLYSEAIHPELWTQDKQYNTIAHSKARLCYRTRMDSWEVVTRHPELLVPGDVRYGGGVFIEPGIIVAFSGLQWWVDEWVSRIAAESLRYIAAGAARYDLSQLEAGGGAFMPN